MKIRPLIAVAVLSLSLTGCLVDPALLSGLANYQQPTSAYGYGYGYQQPTSYGYQPPSSLYPARSYGPIYGNDKDRHERPHDKKFARHQNHR
ncbi:exported hypothetical protein [Rhodospirillaceae bacterium LM-1]|nr:exported hypothetical protein [Rhodospirillaceae bacterium LM-1]